LAAEGVRDIRIVAEEPERHRGETLPPGVIIDPRDRLEAVQRALRETSGVSVLIYDQVCAAEKRRRRKRGQMPDAGKRIVINEAVCEGCGDCGRKSNCVSVVPLETEFGRKRQIDQTTCNQDATCVEGFCPSFVTIEGGVAKKPKSDAIAPPAVPAPLLDLSRRANLVAGGIGGTGIVTVGAILGMAAHLDGRGVSVMDQIGLAQKGGEVTTHVRIAKGPNDIGPVRLAPGEADTLIGCDLAVAATPEVLSLLTPNAIAVINDHVVMTGDFTTNPDLAFPDAAMKRRIAARAETSFADLSALAMALGVAWQKGRVPLTEASILKAIELNGAAVAMNKRAFAWGRALASAPDSVLGRLSGPAQQPVARSLADIVDIRAAELVRYQNEHLARRFRDLVADVANAEDRIRPGSTELATTVARSFHKLLAYKDEYEVARLHVETSFLARLNEQFDSGTLSFHLAPPLFARRDPVTGHPRKMRFGPWVVPVFKLLAKLKFLRGSWADPFGYTAERQSERRTIGQYETLLRTRIIPELTATNHALAVEIAALPLTIRGFGHVKVAAEADALKRQTILLGRWPDAGVTHQAAE
ncbi:MAG: 2-oxoacid:acceptor oxidoreductase family protein, partial [Rhizobiales bacterium]|nr:2-oxoacid:acceptor oxidoreductase family protein [Hyphomicrobiales bacterium]